MLNQPQLFTYHKSRCQTHEFELLGDITVPSYSDQLEMFKYHCCRNRKRGLNVLIMTSWRWPDYEDCISASLLVFSNRENKPQKTTLGAILTFSPCRAGTESRRLWKLSFMWSLRLRSSALWCARLSACNNKSHRAFRLAAQRQWDGTRPIGSAQLPTAAIPKQSE